MAYPLTYFKYACSAVSFVQVIFNKLHLCLSQQHMEHASCGCWVFIFRLVLELPLHKVPGQAMFLRLGFHFGLGYLMDDFRRLSPRVH